MTSIMIRTALRDHIPSDALGALLCERCLSLVRVVRKLSDNWDLARGFISPVERSVGSNKNKRLVLEKAGVLRFTAILGEGREL